MTMQKRNFTVFKTGFGADGDIQEQELDLNTFVVHLIKSVCDGDLAAHQGKRALGNELLKE